MEQSQEIIEVVGGDGFDVSFAGFLEKIQELGDVFFIGNDRGHGFVGGFEEVDETL